MFSSAGRRRPIAVAAVAIAAAGASLVAAAPATAESVDCGNGRLYEVRYETADEYEDDTYASANEGTWVRGDRFVGWGGARPNGWVPVSYWVYGGSWYDIREGANDQRDFFRAAALDFIKCL